MIGKGCGSVSRTLTCSGDEYIMMLGDARSSMLDSGAATGSVQTALPHGKAAPPATTELTFATSASHSRRLVT